jgi:hypothetical protein
MNLSDNVRRRLGLVLMSDHPKLINGKVWVALNGGYCPLSPDDPKYNEILLWMDSQRFVELLDWIYKRRNNVNGTSG